MLASEAVRQAERFLKESLRSGLYGLSCSGSDGTPRVSHNKGHLFAGFFIAEALRDRLDEVERSLLIVRLWSEEANGHWGYAPRADWDGPPDNPFFVDADDTAFALRLVRRLGLYRSPEVLGLYHRSGGLLRRGMGFVTFNQAKRAALCFEPSAPNNLGMHPEVNANVFLALAGTDHSSWITSEIISRCQAKDGAWHGYFYPGPHYATAMFLELIARLGGFRKELRRAATFLESSQNEDGSWGDGPLETALGIKALSFTDAATEAARRGRDFLLATQGADGAWSSESVVWEFHQSAEDVWRARDVNGVVTTALCVAALDGRDGAA